MRYRMSWLLPFGPERMLIGRDEELGRIEKELEPEGARVFICGTSGMGKDVCAVEVLHRQARALVTPSLHGFMPFWVPCYSADDLRGWLHQLATDHLGLATGTEPQSVALQRLAPGGVAGRHAWLVALPRGGASRRS